MRVVVIGAGLGGLAVARRLRHDGHDVTVVERQEAPGGRAYRLRDAGYTWDTGPSLVTMPWVLEEAFAAGGLDLRSEVTMRRLDPMYRIRWAGDERHFDFADDVGRLEAEVARFSPRDARRVRPFLDGLEPVYRSVILDAGRRPFLRAGDFARLVPRMARLGVLPPLHAYVARAFRHPRVREAFSFHSLFIGGDPFRVPALYAALVYLQVADGGWYVDGGVYALVEALARDLDLRCGEPVEAIEWSGERATGVRLAGGGRIAADVVISNADVLRTPALLGRPAPRRRLRPTMSCFLVYMGTRRRWPGLLHHTLLVGPGYRSFIRDVTRRGVVPRTFSTYVHAPSRTEAAMAAPGGDSLAVLLPTPNLRGGTDWTAAADEVRDALVADMERSYGLHGLAADVVVEHRMTPLDFERRLGAEWGNAFSIEPTLGQSAYFRVPNRDRRIRNLYFVGGGTHPGAGIPGVLLGAAITGDLVAADAAAAPRRRVPAGAR
ncbi:phytoene desaturase family protein [Miltoncostaea marina]|uniref:phytoene desaturase family protein n=1 Tax=Miltoncostaea marina TaxID=2843215 RepID=UPI001C3C77DE|nr:phytoene desaturase family protein [Miltoncostaea marina]